MNRAPSDQYNPQRISPDSHSRRPRWLWLLPTLALLLTLGWQFAPTTAHADPGDERWDDQFSVNGLNGTVYALAYDSAGNLYAGGSFSNTGGVAASNIAKWDPNTST